VLKSLLSKGLIQEVGRAERPGRPILYASTSDFLQHFGLNSLSELPPLASDSDPQPDPILAFQD
jgi:segregation and condensation protein B